MADSGHAPARVVGGVRHPNAAPHHHAEEGATAQTTLVTGVDANANNQALAKQGHEAVFDVVEKKKLEPNHDPKVPKHEKHANYKPDVKRTHTIQQPGNHHQ